MIQRLRKRFIRIAMLSVALVLLALSADRERRPISYPRTGIST